MASPVSCMGTRLQRADRVELDQAAKDSIRCPLWGQVGMEFVRVLQNSS